MKKQVTQEEAQGLIDLQKVLDRPEKLSAETLLEVVQIIQKDQDLLMSLNEKFKDVEFQGEVALLQGEKPSKSEIEYLIAPLIPEPKDGIDGVDGITPSNTEIKTLIENVLANLSYLDSIRAMDSKESFTSFLLSKFDIDLSKILKIDFLIKDIQTLESRINNNQKKLNKRINKTESEINKETTKQIENIEKNLNTKIENVILNSKGGGGSGSAATTFKDLTDTPADYSGKQKNIPVVNTAEDGLEFKSVRNTIDKDTNIIIEEFFANAEAHNSTDGTEKVLITDEDNEIIKTITTQSIADLVEGDGETNTASNTGSTGIGVFNQKNGTNLEFKKLKSKNNSLEITNNSTDGTVDFEVKNFKNIYTVDGILTEDRNFDFGGNTMNFGNGYAVFRGINSTTPASHTYPFFLDDSENSSRRKFFGIQFPDTNTTQLDFGAQGNYIKYNSNGNESFEYNARYKNASHIFRINNNEIMRVVADGDSGFSGLGVGISTPATKLDVNGAITQRPLSTDPADPADGNSVQWVSDGTESGDAGDVMMKINIGGTIKTITLIDFSVA